MGNLEVTSQTRELLEQRTLRERNKPILAKQKKGRRAVKSNSPHQVERRVATSRAEDAVAAHEVEHGQVKRWQPAFTLPGVKDPPGYVSCWISRHGRHRGDEEGLRKALSEGWEFGRVKDYPDSHALPTQRSSVHGEMIGNDSAVLMKLPEELKAQRDAYYNGKRDRATRQINKPKPGLAEANDKMPLVEDLNQVQSGLARGRRRIPQSA